MLLTASGVGPKLAQAMLAVHAPDELRRAVASDDVKTLTTVPGIGQKGAQRIILELQGPDRLPGRPLDLARSGADSRCRRLGEPGPGRARGPRLVGQGGRQGRRLRDARRRGRCPSPTSARLLRLALQTLSKA